MEGVKTKMDREKLEETIQEKERLISLLLDTLEMKDKMIQDQRKLIISLSIHKQDRQPNISVRTQTIEYRI